MLVVVVPHDVAVLPVVAIEVSHGRQVPALLGLEGREELAQAEGVDQHVVIGLDQVGRPRTVLLNPLHPGDCLFFPGIGWVSLFRTD